MEPCASSQNWVLFLPLRPWEKKTLALANSISLYEHGVDQEPLNINKQDCMPASAHVLCVDSMHAVWHMCFWCICVYPLV